LEVARNVAKIVVLLTPGTTADLHVPPRWSWFLKRRLAVLQRVSSAAAAEVGVSYIDLGGDRDQDQLSRWPALALHRTQHADARYAVLFRELEAQARLPERIRLSLGPRQTSNAVEAPAPRGAGSSIQPFREP
jgi:hypothetical protein